MKQKKNSFFITILLLLISLAFIVTVSVVFNNIKTNLEREIISSLSEEAEENAALIEKEIDAKFGVLQSFATHLWGKLAAKTCVGNCAVLPKGF